MNARRKSLLGTIGLPIVLATSPFSLSHAGSPQGAQLQAKAAHSAIGETDPVFRRIATFPVYLNTDIDNETVAEIVAANARGDLLAYTDSQLEAIGFINIEDPANPQPDGIVELDGEPTSVAVLKNAYALAAVNTSADFVNTSGSLEVIDLASRTIVRSIDLGGQPDAIAISPDNRYIAVAIENERDEDLGDGKPPQLPAGFLVIVDRNGTNPDNWTTRTVDLTGIADLFPEDPEPEYVDINTGNIAVVTLQEINHIALVDLKTGEVINHFSAGSVDLEQIDTVEDDVISQVDALADVPREPDAVTWTDKNTFVTADEGDLFGGSRGFTTFMDAGPVLYTSGNDLEHLTARLGHYPESRSENKGNEPEVAEFGSYNDGADNFLFIGSERSSLVFVYRIPAGPYGAMTPEYVQTLPTALGPEGLLAIPQRNLFVVSTEEDSRGDGFRGTVSIYKLGDHDANYPTLISGDRADGTPIAWGAVSGLASAPAGTDAGANDTVYAIHDSYYKKSRIYTIDASQTPAVATAETVMTDDNDVLLDSLNNLFNSLADTGDFDPASMINDDGTINVDPEGIAVSADGGFWVASEGAGNLNNGVSDPDDQPFTSPNMLIKTDATGVITDVVMLPLDLTQNQLRFGFEGVAVAYDEASEGVTPDAEVLYVAFQREWSNAGDSDNQVRLGRYDTGTGEWSFAYYPIEKPQSANGGWVGLSDLTWLGNGSFLVIERDNQAGPDAAVKRLYTINVGGVTFQNGEGPFETMAKVLEKDLMASGAYAVTGGLVPEKLEGSTVLSDGSVLVVNDNDGIDDNSGETQLLNLGPLTD